MSVNHVERHALACGFSVERIVRDYGIDLVNFTYDESGEIESGQVFLQLKATDNLRVLRRSGVIAYSLKLSDLRSWLAEPMPFILVVYDARNDRAYWLYLQAYFEEMPGFNLDSAGNTIMVHIPMTHRRSRGDEIVRAIPGSGHAADGARAIGVPAVR